MKAAVFLVSLVVCRAIAHPHHAAKFDASADAPPAGLLVDAETEAGQTHKRGRHGGLVFGSSSKASSTRVSARSSSTPATPAKSSWSLSGAMSRVGNAVSNTVSKVGSVAAKVGSAVQAAGKAAAKVTSTLGINPGWTDKDKLYNGIARSAWGIQDKTVEQLKARTGEADADWRKQKIKRVSLMGASLATKYFGEALHAGLLGSWSIAHTQHVKDFLASLSAALRVWSDESKALLLDSETPVQDAAQKVLKLIMDDAEFAAGKVPGLVADTRFSDVQKSAFLKKKVLGLASKLAACKAIIETLSSTNLAKGNEKFLQFVQDTEKPIRAAFHKALSTPDPATAAAPDPAPAGVAPDAAAPSDPPAGADPSALAAAPPADAAVAPSTVLVEAEAQLRSEMSRVAEAAAQKAVRRFMRRVAHTGP